MAKKKTKKPQPNKTRYKFSKPWFWLTELCLKGLGFFYPSLKAKKVQEQEFTLF